MVARFPLPCSHEQSRVGLDPIEVGIDGLDQRIHASLKVVFVPSEDPVESADRLGDRLAVRFTNDQGNETLVLFDGVLELLATHIGSNRVGSEDEHICLCRIDGAVDLA